MVRILHIVTYMGRGGLETMLMNYYRQIDREQIQFDFLVHRDFEADYDREIKELGGRIYHISRLIPWSRKYRNKLKIFFAKHPEYQIVHVHQDCLSSIALQCAKEMNIPVRIAHSHTSSQDKNFKYPIKLWYKRKISNYATHLMSCGMAAGKWMFGNKDFIVLNNAVPAKKYIYHADIRKKLRTELDLGEYFTIGLVANFTQPKNHIFLLSIFKEVLVLEPQSKLLLVGGGQLKEEIKSHANDLGLENSVIFAGIRSDVPDLLQAMDAFVMPSHYEGLSLAIIEAQASGLPCFISDRVSMECKITDLVRSISLDASAEEWARWILDSKGIPRKNRYQEIVKAGFDVESNVDWLQNFYLEMSK